MCENLRRLDVRTRFACCLVFSSFAPLFALLFAPTFNRSGAALALLAAYVFVHSSFCLRFCLFFCRAFLLTCRSILHVKALLPKRAFGRATSRPVPNLTSIQYSRAIPDHSAIPCGGLLRPACRDPQPGRSIPPALPRLRPLHAVMLACRPIDGP